MASEEELRKEAVRRRRAGESAVEIAAALGRTDRWVRKWTARHEDEPGNAAWAKGRSRRPLTSPNKTSGELRSLILDARARLVAEPRGQYGPLAIAWELRCMGVDPVPGRWTIERVVAEAGLARPRRQGPRYESKHVPYPSPVGVEPGTTHQIDMVGPRHLDGGIEFHALNAIDVGSHRAGSEIIETARPIHVAEALAAIWTRTGVPAVAQLDNHSRFRGGIPPAWQHFGPVVAMCLELDVIARFIPLREPWRNGIVEHFNDVWDKSFFRAHRFAGLAQLRAENAAFEAFHNANHRYSAHHGRSPDEVWASTIPAVPLPTTYRPPTRLPAKGRIEVVRYIRSNGLLDIFGRRFTLADEHTHQYVTAVIRVRSRRLLVVTINGEVALDTPLPVARTLR